MIFLLFFLCFLPLCIWGGYCLYARFLAVKSVIQCFLAGLAAVVAAIGIRLLLEAMLPEIGGVPIWSSVNATGIRSIEYYILSAFIGAGLIEELAKFAILCFLPGVRTKTDVHFDKRGVFSAAVIVGLSFSAFENLGYAIRSPDLLPVRTLAIVPLHASLTLLAAGGIRENRISIQYIFSAIVIHGIFDLCMKLSGPFVWLALVIDGGTLLLAVGLWRRAGREKVGNDSDNQPGSGIF